MPRPRRAQPRFVHQRTRGAAPRSRVGSSRPGRGSGPACSHHPAVWPCWRQACFCSIPHYLAAPSPRFMLFKQFFHSALFACTVYVEEELEPSALLSCARRMRRLIALLLALAILHATCSPLQPPPSAARFRGGQRRGAAGCAVRPRRTQLVAAYAPTGRSGDFSTKKASEDEGEDPVQTWVIACGLGWLYGLGCIVGPFYGVGALLARRRTLAPTHLSPGGASGPHVSFAEKRGVPLARPQAWASSFLWAS